MAWDMDDKPLLVFWETTRACDLACQHCRASAISQALPGELTHQEGVALIDQVAAFGDPAPLLVLTGGDVLKRARLFDLITYARGLGLVVSVSPSVTPLLSHAVLDRWRSLGVAAISISLDGATPSTHDGVRRVPGTWLRSFELIRYAVGIGLKVQINSAVMASNLMELPALFQSIAEVPVHIWEVFFLVKTGRGRGVQESTAAENEAVCHFLYQAGRYGITVRTVEGPFFRRLVRAYETDTAEPPDSLAETLIKDLHRRVGPPVERPRVRSAGTRDGRGIVFVSHDGNISPSGFLPLAVENIRRAPLPVVYRTDRLFRALRSLTPGTISGPCGTCEALAICGGSRARAWAHYGDPLASDPACIRA
ncbi:MAG TPA: TIGR04053 family radical SAM/SPASM domain-containing protein [Candidatus Xenobia bacterium]|jgi:radical SAM protein